MYEKQFSTRIYKNIQDNSEKKIHHLTKLDHDVIFSHAKILKSPDIFLKIWPKEHKKSQLQLSYRNKTSWTQL
jgi:hypothetical protein